MNGIIIVDKPKDWTSHDVIAKLRGALKQKRIGHGGTLDPMATGVLPVFIGRATRAAEFCENAEKEYMAELTLGIVTDTQDITGNVLSENTVTATYADVEAALSQFRGAQKQVPPMYSAVKIDGKKMYELARKGIEVERKPRDVNISVLEMCQGDGCQGDDRFSLRIVCSKGTYIRTLCHDIGQVLGCGGTLSALRRTRAGAYSIDTAHTLDSVLAATSTDTVNDIMLPVDSIFSEYTALAISGSEIRKAKNGADFFVAAPSSKPSDGIYRVYAPDGEFLLLGEAKNGKVRTIKNFFEVGDGKK